MENRPGQNLPAEVELVEVTKQFGDLTAVDHVSITVGSSEFLTLLGPSGCGKTTLLRIIGGFILPDSGRVVLAGVDVTGKPPYRRNVCTVFQQYALFPHMTVSQNVAFGLERRRVPRNEIGGRVRGALEMVRLRGLEERRPSELSGGQQQRVALARAIVLEPKVLLLDEPLAALDLKLRKQMQLELKGLQRHLGISFVYVTHDQEEALTMSDRIAVINLGHIEQIGCAREVYERPKTEFVADFVGMSNIFEGTITRVEGKHLIAEVGQHVPVWIDDFQPGGQRAVGSKVRFMVRPERIVLSPASGDPGAASAPVSPLIVSETGAPAKTFPSSGIPGTVESAFYLGESTRWQIRLAGGQEIHAIEQNSGSDSHSGISIGRQVFVRWASESAVIL